MEWLSSPYTWAGGSIGCLALLLMWLFTRLGRKPKPDVYLTLVDSLLTPAELKFYQTLKLAVEDAMLICCKVRLADLLSVTSLDPAERQKLFRRIAAKHVDFVLADPTDLEPFAAIELDDSSHDRSDRRERDVFVDRLFETVGFPIIRVKAAGRYNVRELREQIASAKRQKSLAQSR
jgi:very-short-patch-repair endonuclease